MKHISISTAAHVFALCVAICCSFLSEEYACVQGCMLAHEPGNNKQPVLSTPHKIMR